MLPIAVAGLSLGLVTLAPSASAAATRTATATGTPYTDPDATGVIGLCNKAGHAVTHGDVAAAPFVWRAVSSSPAATPYDAPGRTATLFAYQPINGLAPGSWSGSQLTASSRYTNPAHPMAQATNKDGSLANFLAQFPARWDGLVQLRIFLGAPNQPTSSVTYAATDIKVTGKTWRVVHGGTVGCTSGRSVSVESLLLPASHPSAGTSPSRGGTTSAASSPAPTATSGTTSATSGTATPTISPSNAAADADNDQGTGHASAIAVGLAAAVVVFIAVGFFIRSRRRGLPSTASEGEK